MSRKTRTTLTAVEKLIEQRRLFQDWLSKLSGEVEGMPPHVVERVRNDYRARLDSVMAELGEHADALRDALGEAQERHDGLETQQQTKKDELAELRLRRHVGEMDEERFKEQSGEMKAALDAIQKDLAAAQKDIERYEEILDVIDSSDEPEEEEEEPEAEEATAVEEPEPEDEPEPVPARAAAPAPRKAPEPPPEPRREERRSSPDVAKPRPGVDELAFLRSVTSAPGQAKAATPPPPSRPAGRPPQQQPHREPSPEQRRVEPPAAAPDEVQFEAAPGLLELPPSEHDEPDAPSAAPAAKKEDSGLVCGECGAVNRPTEWYCEKCGAELAAF